jgi:putative membrane protein
MKDKREFSFNSEKLVQLAILTLIYVFVFDLSDKNILRLYIHPRMNWMICLTLVVIMIFIFVQIPQITIRKNNRAFKSKYLIFILFLFLAFFSPKDMIQSDIAELRGIKIGEDTNVYNKQDDTTGQTAILVNSENNTVKKIETDKDDQVSQGQTKFHRNKNDQNYGTQEQEVADSGNNIKPEKTMTSAAGYTDVDKDTGMQAIDSNRTGGIDIEINDDNYLEVVDALFRNPDDYADKKIKIDGFVFRMDYFSKDQFVVGRMAVFCCTADASLYGILCELNETRSSKLKDYEWLSIWGTIHPETTKFSDNKKIPVIKISGYRIIPEPKDAYVYFRQF